MCKDCGCGQAGGEVTVGGEPMVQETTDQRGHGPVQGHDHQGTHHHDHPHTHHHHDAASGGHEHTTIAIQRSVLEKNERLAEQNRGFFRAKGLLVLNVLSSPGSGKTTFIQKTAEGLAGTLRVGVIVGDLATDNDAARLRRAGIPVVQVTTGTVCHLEAAMVAKAAGQLPLDQLDVLIIENVGNLVCPADFDLGEDLRVVLMSTTEGEDKPLKYPPMFHSANVAVVTKTDLAVASGFDRDLALTNLRRIAHHAEVFEVSAKTGAGMEGWLAYLRKRRHESPR
ncbi:MAG: hydrogenase nickel incorporation protein HypB [Verrucomicrobia bacterium]|jgi:hydrogenase nickel incorporation protein HypB|nr:hydrogenase nickel incorporation protein HypB [Verrucomicrobiota bacterium]